MEQAITQLSAGAKDIQKQSFQDHQQVLQKKTQQPQTWQPFLQQAQAVLPQEHQLQSHQHTQITSPHKKVQGKPHTKVSPGQPHYI